MPSALQLLLDPPYSRSDPQRHLFAPGDIIRGHAILSLKTAETIDNLTVCLSGHLKIQAGRGQDAHAYSTSLFTLRKTLLQGPFKLRGGSAGGDAVSSHSQHTYDFEFVVPAGFEHDFKAFSEESWFPEARRKSGWHALILSLREFDTRSGSCEVVYSVAVKSPRRVGAWEDKAVVYLTTLRSVHQPSMASMVVAGAPKRFSEYTINTRRFRVDAAGVPRALSVGKAFREGFRHHAETRILSFALHAEVPTLIVVGNPYPIRLTIASSSQDEDLTTYTPPSFILSSYQLSLKTKTDVRAPNAIYAPDSTFLSSVIPLSSGKFLDTKQLELNMPTEVNGWFPEYDHHDETSALPPSFTAWPLKRTYALELELKIGCVGEVFACKVHCHGVTLLSTRSEGGGLEGTGNEENEDDEELPPPGYDGETRDALPAYGEILQTGTVEGLIDE